MLLPKTPKQSAIIEVGVDEEGKVSVTTRSNGYAAQSPAVVPATTTSFGDSYPYCAATIGTHPQSPQPPQSS
jgi:hypothetical protein